MYLLVDVAVALLLFIAIWRGLKKGFFNTSYGLIGTLIVIAFSVMLDALIVLIFYKVGVIDSFSRAILRVIGETNGLFAKLNVTSAQISYYVALGIIAIIGFFVSYPIMLFGHKKFLELMDNCRDNTVFRIVDSVIGLIVNLALAIGFILFIYAVIFALNQKNLLLGAGEIIRACPLSSFIFNKNPLSQVICGLSFFQ